MTCGLVVLSLFLVVTGVRGFSLDHDGASQSHWEITEEAVLRATAEACRAEAQEEGRIFTLPATLTPQSLLEACEAKQSAGDFAKNKFQIKSSNALVNIDYALVPSRHFDNEEFEQGKKIITDGLFTVKVNIKNENYGAARRGLGEILHTIQDFYSHSNWVEMGNDHPFTNLIQSGDSLEYSTAKHRPTCRNCSDDCTGNILEDILSERLLTSGYFSPRSSNIKPTGKCSHGGNKDTTTHTDATGGINKDSVNSSHGHLHERAARVATEASIELLDDVHAAVGHKNFLRMMGVGSGKAIIFVIDTTQSMVSDIVFIRLVTIMTIQQLEGTENEPSVYILVPFNDPGFGPVTKTTNGNVFISAVTNLTANGGGDLPEKSLSGLQLALSVAPIGSELFVFTDAPPKDTHLKNTILALIERTQCVVNFVISNNTLKEPIYTDLAKASGGQVVTLKKSDVFSALTLLLDSSNSVTLLQAARKSSDNFMFSVAETETDLRLFITGTTDFTLVSPSGVVQESSTGPLTTSKQTVGDLLLVRLTNETGQWNIRLRSTNSYTLKITVRSPVDFFFSLMQQSELRSTGLAPETNKPSAGQKATLVVVLFGSDSATLKEAYLVYSSGAGELKGNITGHEDNEYLVHFDNLPSEEISVLVKLQDGSSLTKTTLGNFQRQALTSIQPSPISIASSIPSASLEPGSTFFTNLTISTEGTEGNFTIQVSNNQNLPSTIFPAIVNVMRGRSAIAAPEIFIPNTTASGTEIIVVVEVGDAKDFNYKRLTLTAITPVTDIHAPVFSLLSPDPNCTDTCTSTYQLSILVTNNTVLNRIFVREGNGILTFTSIKNVLSYNDSCCSPTVEIVAVDDAGNVGRFRFNVSEARIVAPTTSATTITNTTVTATATTATATNTTATTAASSTNTTATAAATAFNTTATNSTASNTTVTATATTTAATATALVAVVITNATNTTATTAIVTGAATTAAAVIAPTTAIVTAAATNTTASTNTTATAAIITATATTAAAVIAPTTATTAIVTAAATNTTASTNTTATATTAAAAVIAPTTAIVTAAATTAACTPNGSLNTTQLTKSTVYLMLLFYYFLK